RSKRKAAKQLTLDLPELTYQGTQYEYAVLVTSLTDEVRTVAQHYRDRGDAENNFDELKNQWGWAGFTTHDRKRCQIMGRIIALVYNWWTIFMRLGIPDKHAEAITSRPLALHGTLTCASALPGRRVTGIRPRWRLRARMRRHRRLLKY